MTDAPEFGPRYRVTELTEFACAVLCSVGMVDSDARTLGANLVDSDLRGIESHGIVRLAPYIGQMTSGDVALRPEVRLEQRTPVAALVDGGGGFGVLAGMQAMRWTVQTARSYGLAMAGVTNIGHFGTASYYSRAAARQGFIGIAMTNTSPVVAPAGGAEPRLGNNPLSIAVPDGNGDVGFCLDIAMSVVSRGRVKLASLAGRAIPAGWALDAAGAPTESADEALDGALLPFGDYKGAGLSMAIEILAAALTGAQLTQQIRHGGFTEAAAAAEPDQRAVTVGNLFLALNPTAFRAMTDFTADVDSITSWVTSARPRPGQTVRVAGDPEREAEAERAAHGIPLGASTVTSLRMLAERYGVALPTPR